MLTEIVGGCFPEIGPSDAKLRPVGVGGGSPLAILLLLVNTGDLRDGGGDLSTGDLSLGSGLVFIGATCDRVDIDAERILGDAAVRAVEEDDVDEDSC